MEHSKETTCQTQAVLDAPEEVQEIETPEIEAPIATDEQTAPEITQTQDTDTKLPLWKQAQPALDKTES